MSVIAKTIGKNIPTLRFKEFSGEWEEKKLRDITKIYDGTHQTPKYVESGIPFYSVEHVTANQFNETKFISKEVYEYENKRVKLEKKDILMTRIGSIGLARYIDWDVNASFYVSLALIKHNSTFNSRYLSFYIATNNFQRELWKRTIHVAFPQKINLGEIGDCTLFTPSHSEQQKIATFLTAVDTKIEKLTKKKQLLRQYKKGVMQQLFSQKKRFKGFRGEWKEKKLEDVCDLNPKSNSLPEDFVYIDLESVSKGILTKETVISKHEAPSRAQRLLKNGDIIFQTVRPYQMNNYFFNKKNNRYVASTGYAQIRAKESSLFLYQVLHLNRFVGRVIARCTGTSYPAINSTDLAKIKIKIPTLPEQQIIASFLTVLDTKIEHTSKQIKQVKQWKKGLLQQMFV